MEIIEGKKGTYELIQLVASSKAVRTFSCKQDDQEYLLRLSNAPKYNWRIAINEQRLRRLKAHSDRYEEDTDGDLNYDFGFPYVVDDFINTDLNDSRCQACVLGFRGVTEVSKLIPLSRFIKDRIRPDIRSTAWILGKLLKTIQLAHSCDITLDSGLATSNILIEPDSHYVIVFDWHRTLLERKKKDDISQAGAVTLWLLGENPMDCCKDELDRRYVEYLYDLQQQGVSSAVRAHKKHYELVDRMCEDSQSYWEPGFHDFSTSTY